MGAKHSRDAVEYGGDYIDLHCGDDYSDVLLVCQAACQICARLCQRLGTRALVCVFVARSKSSFEKQRVGKLKMLIQCNLRIHCKLTWLALGGDPAARSHRVEQFTAL